jgi:L-threonylcarbamoyladenylate synthase
MNEAIEQAVAALRAAQPVLLPTDTVYGLCADPEGPEPARRLSRLKGRDELQPIALLACDLDHLLERVPELRGRAAVLRALLPGPYTLVVPNPARRYPWLAGATAETIGVRIPELPPAAAAVLDQVGAVAATSANVHGAPDPRRVEDVAEEIRSACGAVLDAGELPGVPSTVLDLSGESPRVLREGAVPAAEALERVSAVAVS